MGPHWWGEKLGAPGMWLTGKMSRAGFEPRRGCTTSPGLDRPENDDILGDAKTHAWLKSGAIQPAKW